jgi:Endosomal/lysosomal potassium channel TMEM175
MAADDERPGPGADPRTLALSDGVFAIAMTLLVLSIGMPRPGEHEHLGSALWHHNADLFSWLLSFAVLGAAWMQHRRLMSSVHDVDQTLTRLNLAYLGAVWPGADHRATPGDNWWTVPAILLLAIPLSLLIGGWAMLSWLLLPLAQRA